MDLKPKIITERDWELGYYHGNSMSKRTKRCLKRQEKKSGTPQVRPLLVLLLEVVKSFKDTSWKAKVGETQSFQSFAEQKFDMLDFPPDSTTEVEQHQPNAGVSTSYLSQEQYQTTFYKQDYIEILKDVIFEQTPTKCRVVYGTITSDSDKNIRFLLECPEELEKRIALALSNMSKSKTSRRKRGRRGGRKRKKGDLKARGRPEAFYETGVQRLLH